MSELTIEERLTALEEKVKHLKDDLQQETLSRLTVQQKVQELRQARRQ